MKADKLPPAAIAVARLLADAVNHLRNGRPVEAGMSLQLAKTLKWKINSSSRCHLRAWHLIDALEAAATGKDIDDVHD